MMAKWVFGLTVLAFCALGAAQAGITIDTVTVGNPGNAADTRYETPGYGAVAYTYNIGKYEVTAGQYTEFLNKVAGVDTYYLYKTPMWAGNFGPKIERYAGSGTVGDPYQYRVAGDYANRPVDCVSFWDACRFANWLHNGQPTGAQGAGTTERGAYTLDGYNDYDGRTIQRSADAKWAVTSEDEWYKAAYYKGGSTNAGYWDYPTSSDVGPGRDMGDASGNNANYSSGGFLIGSPYYRTPVGQFQNSHSPYGTFDQGGNVWEWNEAIIGSYRGMRGGSYGNEGNFHLLASLREYGQVQYGSYGNGFRVSEVPEPTTMSLLALGGLALVRRRRRDG